MDLKRELRFLQNMVIIKNKREEEGEQRGRIFVRKTEKQKHIRVLSGEIRNPHLAKLMVAEVGPFIGWQHWLSHGGFFSKKKKSCISFQNVNQTLVILWFCSSSFPPFLFLDFSIFSFLVFKFPECKTKHADVNVFCKHRDLRWQRIFSCLIRSTTLDSDFRIKT